MSMPRSALVLAALTALFASGATATPWTATAETSCTAVPGAGCAFSCAPGDTIYVAAFGAGAVGGIARCGSIFALCSGVVVCFNTNSPAGIGAGFCIATTATTIAVVCSN
jgi:hypothetical protein